MTGATLTVTSKPQNAAAGVDSRKSKVEAISIKQTIDAASPVRFTIAAGDVDGDGMLDVMMTVKGQGVPTPPPAKN
jgi:hypothetical protein